MTTGMCRQLAAQVFKAYRYGQVEECGQMVVSGDFVTFPVLKVGVMYRFPVLSRV